MSLMNITYLKYLVEYKRNVLFYFFFFFFFRTKLKSATTKLSEKNINKEQFKN